MTVKVADNLLAFKIKVNINQKNYIIYSSRPFPINEIDKKNYKFENHTTYIFNTRNLHVRHRFNIIII